MNLEFLRTPKNYASNISKNVQIWQLSKFWAILLNCIDSIDFVHGTS